jgi:CheY-like chemotaxis protein
MGTEVNKLIMLVDDSVEILQALSFFLEINGFRVVCAENGQEALDKLRSSLTDLPKVIVLDMMMPVMDGFVFRKEQMSDTHLAAIPVIVTTALSGSAISALKKEEFPRVLKKPIVAEELLNAIADTPAA